MQYPTQFSLLAVVDAKFIYHLCINKVNFLPNHRQKHFEFIVEERTEPSDKFWYFPLSNFIALGFKFFCKDLSYFMKVKGIVPDARI